MTTYMKKVDETGVEDIGLASEYLVLCPEVHLGKVKFLDWKVFHVIHGNDVRKLDDLSVAECNRKLRSLSLGHHALLHFHHNDFPVRLSLVSEKTFDELSQMKHLKKGSKECKFEMSN